MESKTPLSPHIQIYRWHISSLVSICHRITGIINVIVILVSGLVATIGFNYIPYKAYVIVAALTGLFAAMVLTKIIKKI